MDPNKPSLVAVMCLVCVVWQKPRHLWQLVAPWAQFCTILGCAALGAADTVHAWSSSQPAAAAGVPPSHFARIAKGGKPGMGGVGRLPSLATGNQEQQGWEGRNQRG